MFAPRRSCSTLLPLRRRRRSRVFHRMTAELVPQRRDHLRAERIRLTRAEACLQRQRDDRRRNVEINRFLDGPAPFTGVGDPPFDVGERLVASEGANREVVEPRAYHTPVLPDGADLLEI